MTAVMEKQRQTQLNDSFTPKKILKFLERNHPKVFEELEDQFLAEKMQETKDDYKNGNYISYTDLKKQYEDYL